MLSRIRLRQATDSDYKRLLERVGVQLPDGDELPQSIVRRHNLREAINILRLKEVSAKNNTPLMYCMARIMERGPKISLETIYSIKHSHKKNYEDAVLSLTPGCSLMVTQNVDRHLGTVHGAFVEFYGFSNDFHNSPTKFTHPPDYMLVKILQGPGSDFVFSDDVPAGVVALKPVTFTYNDPSVNQSVKLAQFPVTLSYSITDYKCQGSTIHGNVIVDLQRPKNGGPAASPYVQLSRATSLDRVFILRHFTKEEMDTPLSKPLQDELLWEEQMHEKTMALYAI